jgi:hypothetical protein
VAGRGGRPGRRWSLTVVAGWSKVRSQRVTAERFRSAADIPGLHRPWTAAVALGVLEVTGDRAAASPELGGWPGKGDLPGRWLGALRAVCDEITGGAADHSLGLLVLALALLRSLAAGIRLSSREVIDAADAIVNQRGLGLMQAHVLGGMSALSRGFLADQMGSLLGLPAGSTRSPARAHPALLRERPSPAAWPSAGITPSSTGTRMSPPARGPSTWPRSTPPWRADPHVYQSSRPRPRAVRSRDIRVGGTAEIGEPPVLRAPGQRVTMTVAWCPAAFLSLTSPVSSSQPSASASAM